MIYQLTDSPLTKEYAGLENTPEFAALTDQQLRYVLLTCDESLDNPFRHLPGVERRLAVVKELTGLTIDATTPQLPEAYTTSPKQYRSWWSIVRGKNKKIRKAIATFRSGIGWPQRIESAYHTAMHHFSDLLASKSEDMKMVSLQVTLAKEWPKLMANLPLLQATTRWMEQALLSPAEEPYQGKSSQEIAAERIAAAELADREQERLLDDEEDPDFTT